MSGAPHKEKKIIEKKNVHFLQNHKKGAGVDRRYIVWGHTDPHAGVTCPCSLLKIWRGDGGGSEKMIILGDLSLVPSLRLNLEKMTLFMTPPD